jgi:hypothetical protein
MARQNLPAAAVSTRHRRLAKLAAEYFVQQNHKDDRTLKTGTALALLMLDTAMGVAMSA